MLIKNVVNYINNDLILRINEFKDFKLALDSFLREGYLSINV